MRLFSDVKKIKFILSLQNAVHEKKNKKKIMQCFVNIQHDL